MRAVRVLFVVAVATLVTAVAGCGGSSSSVTAAPTTPPTAAPTTSPASTSTTAPAAPPVALIPQETPALAAQMLLSAWTAGNRQDALRVATAAAVATVFAQPPESTTDRGCQTGIGGQSYCAFGLQSGGLVQLLTTTLEGGWIVSSATFDG